MELVLRLVQAGKRGMLVSDIGKLGTASGYAGEPNKKIDRIRKNLESAGYSVIRFRGEDGRRRLRLVERPFVPIQVSQEELPEILRLVSAYLASYASYQGGIPEDVQLARSARAQSRTLIAESTSRSFEMIPLGERLLTSGRWEIVGLLPKTETVITPTGMVPETVVPAPAGAEWGLFPVVPAAPVTTVLRLVTPLGTTYVYVPGVVYVEAVDAMVVGVSSAA